MSYLRILRYVYRLLDFSRCYFVGEFPLNLVPHMSDVKLAACCHWRRDFNHTIESAHPLASKMVGMRRL